MTAKLYIFIICDIQKPFFKILGVCKIDDGDATYEPKIIIDTGDDCCLTHSVPLSEAAKDFKPVQVGETTEENQPKATDLAGAAAENASDALKGLTDMKAQLMGDVEKITQCRDHWHKPYCITPDALERLLNARVKVQLNCAATSAARVGLVGAVCHQEDEERLAMTFRKMREVQREKRYLHLIN